MYGHTPVDTVRLRDKGYTQGVRSRRREPWEPWESPGRCLLSTLHMTILVRLSLHT
jgi:hypothetical protein